MKLLALSDADAVRIQRGLAHDPLAWRAFHDGELTLPPDLAFAVKVIARDAAVIERDDESR